ncbi:PDR/VanB family oxidoreductase [Nocardioides sp. CN2-186]|uniref:PDR/VanB family oxidoreductase n=1 Tax=Nocardioides tweenelious TaxID=3156607 RepID=UPI0032B53F68
MNSSSVATPMLRITDSPSQSATAPDGELLLEVSRREVRGEVIVLDLREASGRALPAWQPGAHIELILGSDLIRQYSLCGGLNDTTWRIAVLRVDGGRGGSRLVFDKLTPGTIVEARGPRNHFPLVPAQRYVFIAGGIGITPLVPMIEVAEDARADWVLCYGGRTREDMLLAGELSERYGGNVRLFPHDEYGWIPLDEVMNYAGSDGLVYCCGPETMVKAAELAAAAQGASPRLRTERFQPQADPRVGETAEFEVKLAKSGVTVLVSQDQSILESVAQVGVVVLASCREGVCGTCETFIVDGIPDHRDSVLTPEARASGESMMVCVSRARSRTLVLDL